MEIDYVNNEIKRSLQVRRTKETQAQEEEQVQVKAEPKERDETGPWTLWSDLKPGATKCSCICECQSESALLTDILIRYSNNPEDITALHYAVLQNDIVAVDLLLKHGASPFAVSKGNHSLYYAIKAGSVELFKKFVGLGYDHFKPTIYDGLNAFSLAVRFHQTDIAKFILESYFHDLEDDRVRDRMMAQCTSYGSYELFEILVNRYKDFEVDYKEIGRNALSGRGPLGDRKQYNTPEAQTVIQGKLKILDTFSNGELLACFWESGYASHIILNTFPDALNYLIDRKIINPNSRIDKSSVIFIACKHNAYANELVEILLSRGVDTLDSDYKYIIFHVTYGYKSTEDKQTLERKKQLMLTLLHTGIDINLRSQQGKSVLDLSYDNTWTAFLKGLGAK